MSHLPIVLAVLGGFSAAVTPLPAQTWVTLTAPSTNIGPIACSADGSKLVLAGGYWFGQGGVLYVSDDSGATWTAGDAPVGLWSALASSADGSVLMAAESRSAALYTSADSGATWRLSGLTNVYSGSYFEPYFVEPYLGLLYGGLACSADGTRMFAVAAETTNGSPGAIYASADSGVTWAPTPAPAAGWGSLACSADGNTVVAGEGTNVWVSTNSGATFGLAYTLAPGCVSVACSADGVRMAAGIDTDYNHPWAGIATSGDSGATWIFRTNGVALLRFVWLLAYSADGSRMVAVGAGPSLGGHVPFSAMFLSDNSGASWGGAPPLDDYGNSPPWTGAAMSADGCKVAGVYVKNIASSFAAVVADLQAKPAPRLWIAGSRGSLVLSWTVPSVNLVLQQSPSLTTTNWMDVAGTPVLDYATLRNQVTVPARAGAMFYRLTSR